MEKTTYEVTSKEGYLGARAWTGSNYRRLYGAELSKVLRAEFKKNSLKGVTVSCKTYTGGQSVSIKFKPQKADFIPLEDYLDKKLSNGINFFQFVSSWIDYHGARLTAEDCYRLPEGEKNQLYVQLCLEHYNKVFEPSTHGTTLVLSRNRECKFHDVFTPAYLKKLLFVKTIVDSFNYDESNSMADYYDTGFYTKYYVVPWQKK